MPHYPFPDFIKKDVRLTTWQGQPHVQFAVEHEHHWPMIIRIGGLRLMNSALIPTSAQIFKPKFCPPDVEMYRINSGLGIFHLREKKRKFENMSFPKGCMAFIVDTNMPVDQLFADNLAGYAAGLIGAETTCSWMSRFFEDMKIGADPTPFAKHSSSIVQNGKLYVASPWPTPGYNSNGLSSIVNNQSLDLISGGDIKMSQLLTEYQWPARMSVAFLFKKKLDDYDFLLNILKKRTERFCKMYPNEGRFHEIRNWRWMDTSRLSMWNDYDLAVEEKPRCVRKGFQKAMESYDSFWDNTPIEIRKPQKIKIEIEEISTPSYDL